MWCAAALAACGTGALAGHSLLSPESLRNAAPAGETIRAAAASIEASLPDLPGPLAGLDEAATSPALPSSLFLFSSFSPVATAEMMRTDDAAPAPADARDTFREIVRQEAAARDPTVASVSVPRPPPRPAFIEARTRTGSEVSGRGFDEVRAPSSDPAAWSEAAASPSGLTWPFGEPDSPASTAKGGRPLQAGMASWYGPGFHGRKTASGEIFNQNAMTAAHPRLPFGTKVRVVDEKTGRSVVVRINDRGPYAHGRIIDLSKGSAHALGMLGIGRVKIVSAE